MNTIKKSNLLTMKFFLLCFFLSVFITIGKGQSRVAETAETISAERMQQVYDEVKTPYKYGPVLTGENGLFVNCPNIFRYKKVWYMVYVCLIPPKVGYQTYLARSKDLLHWEKLGAIMSFPQDGWDRWNVAGSIALCDPTWGGSSELQTFDGKYWMSYIGGSLQGHETDPLAIGMAWSKTPTEVKEWTRIAENPVLSNTQPDVREFEKTTLYKSQIVWDKAKTTGHPFVMFYNGKLFRGYERIGMAVSDDMVHWQRYGEEPVIASGEKKEMGGISGDPQIVKIGDLWVMFYFGAFYQPGIFETFACSTDLVHWTKWTGPHLVESSEPWDAKSAHKPWVIKHDGVVYHFYCADAKEGRDFNRTSGNQGRVIALATSKDLRQQPVRNEK